MKEQVLILLNLGESERRQFEAAFPNGVFTYAKTGEETREQVAAANVIIGNVSPTFAADAPNLKWIQTQSAGVDGYLAAGVFEKGVQVTNATGAYGQAVAEHMFAMLLALQKNLPLYRDQQRESLWHDAGIMAQTMRESTVLTVGLGDIGGTFSRLCKTVGAKKTIGVRRSGALTSPDADEVYRFDKLDELLPQADVVALALPGTPQTVNMFSRERLSRCKRGALILNVGRGSAIDQEALCDLIESGHLGGAGLDVTDPEPLPASHRLWQLPQVLLTPHVSGGEHLAATVRNIKSIALENLQRYASGQPLRNVIDPSTGYAAK